MAKEDPAFHVQDVPWIATAIGFAIRVTVRPAVLEATHDHCADLQREQIYGSGRVKARLLFSWTQVGHWDVLLPSSPHEGDLRLCPMLLGWSQFQGGSSG